MLSVAAAKKIILEHTAVLPPQTLPVQEAAGLVLAAAVVAPATIPAFRQSSMDGYAFCYDDWQLHKKLLIRGIVPAGSSNNIPLEPGTAVRIFTGAAVPAGADTVAMQEKTVVQDGALFIEDNQLQTGTNVRPEGGEIKAGECALEKNTLLTPPAIGFLTAIGITHVLVYPRPSVSIIVTGDELQQPGTPLAYGQVYESNSISLTAALQQYQLQPAVIYRVADNLEAVTAMLRQALQETDVVLLTGGISMGDFDFVLQATIENNVQQLFHRVKQRPAKPLYFGKQNNRYVFGLPGNPSSGLVSFYEYVLPMLGLLSKRNYRLQAMQVPLEKAFNKPAGLTHFLKGWYNGETVAVLDAQESYRLRSFAKANCLIQVDENTTACARGDLMEIHILPV